MNEASANRTPARNVGAGIALAFLILVIGLIDHISGNDLDTAPFYFIPVGLAAWQLGLIPGIAAALCSGLVQFLANAFAGRIYSSHTIAVWNTVVLICVFLVVAVAFARIRELLFKERALTIELNRSLAQVQVLQGLLPICASCKKIRNTSGGWEQVERYIEKRSGAQFTHGMCPECARKLLREAGLSEDLIEQELSDEAETPNKA